MKKRGMLFATIVTAILVLITLFGAFGVYRMITDKSVRYLLGYGDMAEFDQSLIDRYNITSQVSKDAMDSVNAFVYAVNKLAYIDTKIEKGEDATKDELSVYKEFGDVRVVSAMKGLQELKLGVSDKDPKERVVAAIADCWRIFISEGKQNVGCYNIYADSMDGEIDYDSLVKYVDDNGLKEIPAIAEVFGWNKNIEFKGVIDKNTANEAANMVMCAVNGWTNDLVLITNNWGACNINHAEFDKDLQINVVGFSLPQEVNMIDNTLQQGLVEGALRHGAYTVEAWLNAYGDPQYLLFYETFPKEEAAYWQADAYRVALGTILAVEGGFLLLDYIPVVGGLLKAGSKIAGSGAKATLRGASRTAAKEATEELGEKAAKEALESGAQKLTTAEAKKLGFQRLGTGIVNLWKLTTGKMISRKLATKRATNMLVHIFGKDASEEAIEKGAKELVGAVAGNKGLLQSMGPAELKEFLKNADPVLDDLLKEIGDTAIEESMDKYLTKISKDIFEKSVMTDVIGGGAKSLAGRALKPKHIVAASAAYYALKLESMEQKFRPWGTNTIGLKTPYKDTVAYGELPIAENNVDEYFKRYGETFTLGENGEEAGLQGMLPVTNRYYLSLARDKVNNWWDQDPQRFYLASPCYANMRMKVTRCECEGYKDEDAYLFWTGEPIHMTDGTTLTVENFDQLTDDDGNLILNKNKQPINRGTKMAFTYTDQGSYLKECYKSAWFGWNDETTKPLCIQIDTVLDDTEKDNYCYHGKNTAISSLKVVMTSVEVATPLILEAACIAGGAAGGVAGAAAGGAAGLGVGAVPGAAAGATASYLACKGLVPIISASVGAGGEYAKAQIDAHHMWPNHD